FSVKKIWDTAPHSAFTDLIRFNDTFYCTFREGTGHVPGKKTGDGDGEIRVIKSKDGETWESVTLIKKKGYDLRDSKISVTPDNRLMLTIGGSVYVDGRLTERHPQVSFSDKNGENFSEPQPIEIDASVKTPTDWLWRVTWYQGIGYGVVYADFGNNPWSLTLVKTKDGVHYEPVQRFNKTTRPNEATVRFLSNGDMRIFLRCESGNAELGMSANPYTTWNWVDLGIRVGGPEMIILPNDKLLFGHRFYSNTGSSTVLTKQGTDGKLQLVIRFPSGGDTSYPGMVICNGFLWVSYYSGHEGKTSIYLAKIPLENIEIEISKESEFNTFR
ncbi:MAG: glycoside hydrolase, partial [Planctomycetaceae bacterium]|nr:glycoside hydrolase [Planctomycetaceae bacterium]